MSQWIQEVGAERQVQRSMGRNPAAGLSAMLAESGPSIALTEAWLLQPRGLCAREVPHAPVPSPLRLLSPLILRSV